MLAFAMVCLWARSAEIFYGRVDLKGRGVFENLLASSHDQNQPLPCNSSWAFAVAGALSAQLNFLRKGAFPQTNLSVQFMLNCFPVEQSCSYELPGVEMEEVLNFLLREGLPSESCSHYASSDSKTCRPRNRCATCNKFIHSWDAQVCTSAPYASFSIQKFEDLSWIRPQSFRQVHERMLNALIKSGPIICQIEHGEKLFTFRTKDFIELYRSEEKGTYQTWVAVVGYQRDRWILQHSFGQNVGYYGLISLDGSPEENPLGLKNKCFSILANPEPKIVPNPEAYVSADIFPPEFAKILAKRDIDSEVRDSSPSETTKSAEENQKPESQDIPPSKPTNFEPGKVSDDKDVDWRSDEGRNWLTQPKSEYLPGFCKSNWALAAVTMLADRLKIARSYLGISYPELTFSSQALINCKEGGSCYGGDPTAVFERGFVWKLPIETCAQSTFRNPENYFCQTESVCKVRSEMKIYPVESFAGVTIRSWGRLRGPVKIKEELRKGPVVCSMFVSKEFANYSRISSKKLNIFSTQRDFFRPNHFVEIIGFGSEGGVEYWIVRNFWGQEWGYDGVAYVALGINLLGIEADCSFAVPDFSEF